MLDILRRTVGAGPHFFRLISDNLRSITIDNAASNVKYTKISVKIDPKTSGANATQTLDGAEITLYAE